MTDAFAITPPSAPMLAMPITSHAQSVKDTLAAEGRPEPDDIPEPEVPVEASRMPQEPTAPPTMSEVWREHEALAKGFLEYLQRKLDAHILDKFRVNQRALDAMCESITRQVEATLFNQRMYAPYSVVIQAMSPNGYPFTMTITKDTKEALRDELIDTALWLAQNGCKAVSDIP